ncbi:MAG: hypothetical protein AAF530_03370 [Pseudomonadota bacterium]
MGIRSITAPQRHSAAGQPSDQGFSNLVDRLGRAKAPSGSLLLVHLSRLQPYSRKEKHLRTAISIVTPLVLRYDGVCFQLHNDDLAVVLQTAQNDLTTGIVGKLCKLFGQDPLLVSGSDPEKLSSWYDLSENLSKVAQLAAFYRDGAQELLSGEGDILPNSKGSSGSIALDPSHLAVIQNAILQADLSTMISRQPICAIVGSADPQPIFDEIHISIQSLAGTLLPNCDLSANPWLFQELTRHLDSRMIAILMRNDDATLTNSFCINLNVATITSPEFLNLDANLNDKRRHSIVIDLQLIDVFSDFDGYLFARDFLHERGYRICLDGLTHHALASIVPPTDLGFDLAKIIWTPELGDILASPSAKRFYNALKAIKRERLILSRCDSANAVEIGQALGITMYQGFYVDALRAGTIRSNEKVKQLSDALSRQRASTRSMKQEQSAKA